MRAMEEQKVPNVDVYLISKLDKTEDSSIVYGILEFHFISWCNQNDCLFLGFVIEWEL